MFIPLLILQFSQCRKILSRASYSIHHQALPSSLVFKCVNLMRLTFMRRFLSKLFCHHSCNWDPKMIFKKGDLIEHRETSSLEMIRRSSAEEHEKVRKSSSQSIRFCHISYGERRLAVRLVFATSNTLLLYKMFIMITVTSRNISFFIFIFCLTSHFGEYKGIN